MDNYISFTEARYDFFIETRENLTGLTIIVRQNGSKKNEQQEEPIENLFFAISPLPRILGISYLPDDLSLGISVSFKHSDGKEIVNNVLSDIKLRLEQQGFSISSSVVKEFDWRY